MKTSKTSFLTSLRLLSTCCVSFWLVAPPVPAQSPPVLSVQVSNGYAWLSVTGAVGNAYEVQYVTNLAQTNAWLWLTNVTLASNPQSWVDTSCPATGRRFYRAVWVPANMVLIPAGSFTMGNCMDPTEGWENELPLHTVYVSAFYMDRYEVTKALWDEVKAWSGGNGYNFLPSGGGRAANHPVYFIACSYALMWCNARSEKEQLTPCYYADAALTTVYRTGQMAPYVKWDANGYRLPTEAEWEKAARGGASGHRFPWSDTDTIMHSRANYYSESYSPLAYDTSPTRGYHPAFATGDEPYTSPVGYFPANGYGLYDMAGNVFEWCWDLYDGNWYANSQAIQDNTRGPAIGNSRLVRGGCWAYPASDARCANRYARSPLDSYNFVGFRCVRGL